LLPNLKPNLDGLRFETNFCLVLKIETKTQMKHFFNHQNEWLTPQEAAKIAGVSIETLRRWLHAGFIPSNAIFRIGPKRVRYSRSWIQSPINIPHQGAQ
jgi:excisionase family DNA binding protein